MNPLSLPSSIPFKADEIRIITQKGSPVEVILSLEQFQRLMDLIEELEDRADFIALKDEPARDFDTFLKEL
jgi:hypothetical protein